VEADIAVGLTIIAGLAVRPGRRESAHDRERAGKLPCEMATAAQQRPELVGDGCPGGTEGRASG
jgi:hypothetical protein